MVHSENSPEQLLRENSLFKCPIDVEALAKTLDISVKYEPLADGFSAFLLIKDGRATAFVNSEHHPNRQRFSLAHEIGHYQLHYLQERRDRVFLDKNLRFYTRRDDPAGSDAHSSMEKEANAYAATLLMPEELLTKYIARHELDLADEFDVCRLAIAFGVSEQALQIRLNSLKLTEPNF